MTDYPFKAEIVVDPNNPMNVVQEGAVYFYDPSDEDGVSPISLKDLSGLPLSNPVTSNAVGALSPFVATIPQVKWKSGPWTGTFESFDGLRNEAILARQAAEEARSAAVTAGADAAAVAEAALAGAVSDAAESALSAAAAQTSALGAQASAEAAAAATAGGGFTVDPGNANVLLISTLDDGTVAVDPTNTNVLLITI